MTIDRRRFLELAGGAALAPALSHSAWAQGYPARPVQLVVPYPPGSGPDIIARLTAQHLSERLGQQFIVENRPGASTNIGTEYVAKAEPDGYTILLPVSTNAVNVALYRNLNFDFIRDIAPIAGIAKTPFIIVVPPSFPAATLSEFTAYLKGNPNKVNVASNGIGSSPHVCAELFQLMTGTKMVHVPYRGNYMPDLLAGQVQVVFAPIGESLKGYDGFGWYGLGAPAKTPPEIIKKLSDATNEALSNPMINERFSQLGVEPMPLTAAAFAKHIAEEVDKWG